MGKQNQKNETRMVISQEDIMKMTKQVEKCGWKRVTNTKGTREIKQYQPRFPKINAGMEVFVRSRKLEEIVKKTVPTGCGKLNVPPRFPLYRQEKDTKSVAPVPDCTHLPKLSHFHEIDSLVSLQSTIPSLVISMDTEFETCLDDMTRIPVSFQFSVIDGTSLTEVIFLVCHPKVSLELNFCLGWLLDYLAIYEGVKSSDIFHYQSCCGFDNGKPILQQFDYSDFDKACNNAKYKYSREKGKFIPDLIPKRSFPYSQKDWSCTHRLVDVSNVYFIPVTIVGHFGRIDISGFCDYEYHMRRCADVQGGTITMKSYRIFPECHQKASYGNERERHHCYPVLLQFADTMCHAPAGMKKLENLGDVVGVPKVDLDALYPEKNYISHIHDLLMDDPVTFLEYAGTDAVVTLLYASALYGYNKKLPATITSATAKCLQTKMMEFFNLRTVDEFNKVYRGLHTVNRGLVEVEHGKLVNEYSMESISSDADIVQTFSKNAYHGGYNGSSIIGSYTGFATYDYDICSAYSSVMAMIPDIDWENPIAKELTNTPLSLEYWKNEDERLDLKKVGFFEVDFEFPEDVEYPCFCCMDNNVPVYPRKSSAVSGSVYVSAQDIYLALQLGAKVYCKRGYFCNVLKTQSGDVSHSLRSGVVKLINDRARAKSNYGKKSLEELILKTMVNSFYGKIAQNVIDKRTWNAHFNKMESIGISSVTNPVSACMITSYIRCILIATHNQLSRLGYHCYSVTTDGFISDVSQNVLDSLDLFGFRDFLLSARAIIGDSGATSCFEIKHHQTELLNFTTRGNVSLSEEGVCAHNSYCTDFEKDSAEDRKSLITTVLSRTERCAYTKESAPQFKAILNHHIVPIFTEETKHISMDFDMKRKPVRESMHNVTCQVDDETYEICNFTTKPFETVEEFRMYRKNAEACRANGCLRTMEHWDVFYARLISDSSENHVQRHFKRSAKTSDIPWKILTSVIMGYRLGLWSIPYLDTEELSLEEKLAWINSFNETGKEFTINHWKNCRRKDRESQMLHQEMLNELLQKMQQYHPSTLTEQTEIITLDDTLQESCEITEPSCTEIKTQLPTTQRTTIQQTATKPFSKTTAPSFYWELFPRKQKKKPILPQTKSFQIFPVERKKVSSQPLSYHNRESSYRPRGHGVKHFLHPNTEVRPP